MSDPHQELFLRFRERGDVAALGALFDGLAVELFRLALFLAPNASDAEDLVQGTFLSAIESADAYDDSRPLRPWLTGILANLARRRRRDRNRSQPSEIPDGLAASVDVDTSGPAERAEIRECFAEAMRGLPQPYRQVLTLHLQEGMTARRIGEVLERPAGTVRSQVVRGLELLRKAMPAGVVGALAVTFSAGHALAGVRIDVLRAAADFSPVPSATGGALADGALRMAPRYLVTAAAVLLAGLIWVWSRPTNAELQPPASAAVGASVEPTVVASGVLPQSRPTDDAGSQRSPAAGATPVALKVQLVDREGTAQPGLTCRVVKTGGEMALFAVKCVRDDSSSLMSDADGWIAFEGHGSGAYDVWLVGTNTRRRVNLPGPAAATGITWQIPPVHVVKGHVRAPDGTALAGIDIYASASAGSMDVAVPVAQSSHDGSFAFPLAGARTFVWAAGDGLCSHASATTDADVELGLAVAAASLHVTVMGAGGKPAAGAVVAGFSTVSGGMLRPVLFALTDDHGTALFAGLPPGELVVVARNGVDNSVRRTVVVNSGATPSVTLRLNPGAAVAGRVVDTTGAPVRRCAVFAQAPQLRANSFDGRLYDRVAWTDADGRYTLTGLPRGNVRLRLTAWGTKRELNYKPLQLESGERRKLDWRIDQRQLTGRVEGVTDPTRYSVTVTPTDPSGHVLPVYRFVEAVEPDGTFVMLVPPRFSAVCVHVARTGSPAPLVFYHARAVVRDLKKPIELTVSPASSGCATVTATLLDERDRRARVALVRNGMHTSKTLGSSAHITFAGVAVGQYSLRVERADGFVWTRAVEVVAEGRSVHLGNLAAAAEGILVVEAQGELDLRLRDSRGCAVRNVALATATALEAGSYELLVRGADAVPQTIPVTIEAGGETRPALATQRGARCVFEFRFDPLDNTTDIRAELSIAVFDAKGGLVVDGRVRQPHEQAYRWTQTLATGVYRIDAVAAWGGVASGTVRVDGKTPVNWNRELRLR